MKISLITTTADRPVGLDLCERFIARQTVQPDEWIVADGGATPAICAAGQIHVYDPRPPGAANLAYNLLNGIKAAKGDVLIFIEDDDFYHPTHIETLVAALDRPGAILAGDDRQHYYNVAHRCWRTFANFGASMCQTGMRRGALGILDAVIRQCLASGTYGIDATLWRAVATAQWAIARGTPATCIGIKGLPGQVGLGIGHRPAGAAWKADPELAQLRAWIGGDADLYAGYIAAA